MLVCATDTGETTHAYLGHPGKMDEVEVHGFNACRDGGSFWLVTSVGAYSYAVESEMSTFDWFKEEQTGCSKDLLKAIDRGQIEWERGETLATVPVPEQATEFDRTVVSRISTIVIDTVFLRG